MIASGGLVYAQGGEDKEDQEDKEDDNNKQNEDKNKQNEDNNKQNNNGGGGGGGGDKNDVDTESPSMQPSKSPTQNPTRRPTTRSPTRGPRTTGLPTRLPTNSPTNLPTASPVVSEVRLPEISIDITTVVEDIFSFAALLLDDGNNNREGLNIFFRQFVKDLLIAKSTKFTPMRIVLDGTMSYYVEEGESTAAADNNVLLIEDNMSYTLAVYFSFWTTDEMVKTLSDFGLSDPKITSVSVDGKVILVVPTTTTTASTSSITDDNGSGDNNDNNNSGDVGGNLLVVPNANDPASITSSSSEDDVTAIVSRSHTIQYSRLLSTVSALLLILLSNILV
ncbi:hypothetical protein FRACYDRAFT_261356 [Fragilariopsis cylindrus CCMP1102]|uniref:Uncharacterized protein n=1 Tax=Fragilariopsis cylindrus CCMP1102 TaxID=635003 RepID=A0A1E7FEX0_9STRA|nr:hypothetical protein FRACYDRAFT_261356 [Fragilariopsis cylindrus CCMP1102]|eukprot:OEU16710.1 hypothetical protein FRACYDRAFT_261356 [Fragilariopsis cylindrus CCMP1102]